MIAKAGLHTIERTLKKAFFLPSTAQKVGINPFLALIIHGFRWLISIQFLDKE